MTLYGSLGQLTRPGKAGAAGFTFQFVITAGGQTATISRIKPTGGALVISWGDGGTTTVSAGDATSKTHVYAAAGTYDVTFDQPGRITELRLDDGKIRGNFNINPLPSGLTNLSLYNIASLTYNANVNPLPSGLTYLYLGVLPSLTYNANVNPLPSGLTYLYLGLLTGLTYNANANPLPSGLTYLYLHNLSGLTWQINASQPWPTEATACVVINSPSVTVSQWTDNAVQSVRLENGYSQANVDAVIAAIYANRANFTYATPSLDLLGGSNAAPSGVYQAANPPTTGKEMLYSLVNDNMGEGFIKWTVAYQA